MASTDTQGPTLKQNASNILIHHKYEFFNFLKALYKCDFLANFVMRTESSQNRRNQFSG